VAHLFDKLPQEISYIREYALKYGRDTKEETFNFIHETASRQELRELQDLDNKILENGHLDILFAFIKSNLETRPEEAVKLESFIVAIMATPA
jgi:hypothetical protein